ncbi:MAG TPA: DUF1836 domain-containing protein [Candidatus Atribacteria bacterium]|nr:DUF1836 domain-containing protein [Candidatus Atribacteria bacterium]HPT77754.1 DUF1836 domain-containing protein [Candidatus Atribacteria bacterium]
MDLELLSQVFDSIKNEDIKLEDMPEYRLYVSQLEEFFDKRLGKGLGDEEERKTISKTMVQNYIKDGLLMPPEGKCYNRSHVVLLTLIYNLKSILAIKDIKKLLAPILKEVDDESNSTDIEYIYDGYLKLKDKSLKRFFNSVTDRHKLVLELPKLENKTEEEWSKIQLMLFVATLVAEANNQKKIAEYIIETFFKG